MQPNSSIEGLARGETTATWECARYCQYPVELVLKLDYRCEVAHVVLCAKEDRYIPEVELHVGDGLSNHFLDVEYRKAG